MLAIAWYLIKVLLCSGILFGYYWIALRNKKFHLYNRFYLLIAVALSCMIPLMRIDFFFEAQEQPQVIHLFTMVSSGNQYVEAVSANRGFLWDWGALAILAFSFISAIFLARLIIGIIRIKLLINTGTKKKMNDIYFIFSTAEGTPFSFFRYIFWNENIKLDSEDGKHILKHELAHVHEKHSADKLFIQLSLIVGWYNPFMWLIRKELNMIHEFIADEQAIKNGDTAAFASMILHAAYNPYSFALSNPFFYSPIKRRLLMLTSSKNTSFTYLRRVAILPLLAVTCLLFAFQLKSKKQINVSAENEAENIEEVRYPLIPMEDIIENDTTIKRKADTPLLRQNMEEVIVIGYGAGSKNTSDLKEQVVIGYPTKRPNTDTTLKIKGEVVVAGFRKTGKTDGLEERVAIGYPSKTAMAKSLFVVDGIIMTSEDFGNLDLSPDKIKTINVLKGESAVEKFGEKARNGIIEIFTGPVSLNLQEKRFDKIFTRVENPPVFSKGEVGLGSYIQSNMQYPKEAMEKKAQGKVVIKFVVDEEGELSGFEPLTSLGNGLETEAIRLLRNSGPWKPAMQNGRKVVYQVKQEIDFTLNDQKNGDVIPAQFPGGTTGWKKYLERNLNAGVLAEKGAPAGNYAVVVKFNVSKEGIVSNIIAETKTGYGTEEEAIRIIKNGPKWWPAHKNGTSVNSQVSQRISFQVVED